MFEEDRRNVCLQVMSYIVILLINDFLASEISESFKGSRVQLFVIIQHRVV